MLAFRHFSHGLASSSSMLFVIYYTNVTGFNKLVASSGALHLYSCFYKKKGFVFVLVLPIRK